MFGHAKSRRGRLPSAAVLFSAPATAGQLLSSAAFCDKWSAPFRTLRKDGRGGGGVFRQSAGIRGKKSCNILYNPTLRNAPGFGKMDTSTSTSYFWAGGRLCPIGHGVPAHCDAAVCLCLCHFCVKAGGIRLYGRVRVLNPDGRAQRRRPPQ